MSGTDEELHYVSESGMDHVTYVLVMYRFVSSPLVVLEIVANFVYRCSTLAWHLSSMHSQFS